MFHRKKERNMLNEKWCTFLGDTCNFNNSKNNMDSQKIV